MTSFFLFNVRMVDGEEFWDRWSRLNKWRRVVCWKILQTIPNPIPEFRQNVEVGHVMKNDESADIVCHAEETKSCDEKKQTVKQCTCGCRPKKCVIL